MNYNKIINGLYVGDINSPNPFLQEHPDGIVICVLEILPQGEPSQAFWVPIMDPHSLYTEPNEPKVNTNNLKLIRRLINHHLIKGRDVLVHCAAGQERSPLAVAAYLAWVGDGMDIEEAYKIVKQGRPQTLDRRYWL